jgi:cysteinyl-tRNA synthetase
MNLYERYPLQIFNTLKRQKETFSPILPGKVGMYVCGPTVYNEPHIGNVRTFTSFDLVYRLLTYLGYKVRYVRNITDAGHLTNERGEGVNRMESQAKLESLEPMEIVQKYTVSFHRIMELFNNIPPTIEPTATGHIVEQIEMIETLIQKGFAYEVKGSVYFDVKKYSESYNYGELSGRKIDDLMAGYRDLDGQEDKRNSIDFALWKSASPEHIMQWKSPWGMGFPGWHLECSVMSTKYLGETFDIHGGGMDLKFPHHECEIAQNNGSCDHGGAQYWMHTNMLNFNGQKMSKSLGNSILPIQFINGDHPLLDKGYSANTVRFLFLQTHYSSELDINIKGLQDAEKGLNRLLNAHDVVQKLNLGKVPKENGALDKELMDLRNQCIANLCDDFNTAKAMAILFEITNTINSWKNGQKAIDQYSQEAINELKKFYAEILFDVFGLKQEVHGNANALDAAMNLIIDLRAQARTNKDWTSADKIRDQLAVAGITIKDEKDGTTTYSAE